MNPQPDVLGYDAIATLIKFIRSVSTDPAVLDVTNAIADDPQFKLQVERLMQRCNPDDPGYMLLLLIASIAKQWM